MGLLGVRRHRALIGMGAVACAVLAFRAVDVLIKAHALRVERGDHPLSDENVADAIELLLAMREQLPFEAEPLSS